MPEEYDIGSDDEGCYNDTAVVEHSDDAANGALTTSAWSEVDPFAEEEESRALIEDIFRGESIEFELDLGDAAGDSAGYERGSVGPRGMDASERGSVGPRGMDASGSGFAGFLGEKECISP